METLAGLLMSLAVVAIAGGGIAMIAGLSALRERLFGIAILLVIAAIGISVTVSVLGKMFMNNSVNDINNTSIVGNHHDDGHAVVLGAFVLGHAVLGLAMWRRRGHGAGRDSDEIERVRGRVRPRLPPEGGQAEE